LATAYKLCITSGKSRVFKKDISDITKKKISSELVEDTKNGTASFSFSTCQHFKV